MLGDCEMSYMNETVLLRVAATRFYRARDLPGGIPLGYRENAHLAPSIHTSCASGNVGARARPSETAERHAGCGALSGRGIVHRGRERAALDLIIPSGFYADICVVSTCARSVGVAGRKLNERVRASLGRRLLRIPRIFFKRARFSSRLMR